LPREEEKKRIEKNIYCHEIGLERIVQLLYYLLRCGPRSHPEDGDYNSTTEVPYSPLAIITILSLNSAFSRSSETRPRGSIQGLLFLMLSERVWRPARDELFLLRVVGVTQRGKPHITGIKMRGSRQGVSKTTQKKRYLEHSGLKKKLQRDNTNKKWANSFWTEDSKKWRIRKAGGRIKSGKGIMLKKKVLALTKKMGRNKDEGGRVNHAELKAG